MNPYKEDGPCARLSFDPAYCKRCTGPPSVNDGYITGPGRRRPRGCISRRPFRRGMAAPSGTAATPLEPAPGPLHTCGNAPPGALPTRVRGRCTARHYRDD